jgi:hypothetical protein
LKIHSIVPLFSLPVPVVFLDLFHFLLEFACLMMLRAKAALELAPLILYLVGTGFAGKFIISRENGVLYATTPKVFLCFFVRHVECFKADAVFVRPYQFHDAGNEYRFG